jgi:hypothetical protein
MKLYHHPISISARKARLAIKRRRRLRGGDA